MRIIIGLKFSDYTTVRATWAYSSYTLVPTEQQTRVSVSSLSNFQISVATDQMYNL